MKMKKIKNGPTLELEQECGFPEREIIGVDEVGRGCLFGSVISAAVILPEAWGGCSLPQLIQKFPILKCIDDSKKMTVSNREKVSEFLKNEIDFAIGEASVEEIDSINILNATFLAMERAIEKLSPGSKERIVFIDGNRASQNLRKKYDLKTIIKGDQKSLSIACASVIAKVYRDHQMQTHSKDFPNYQIEKHKGYGTKIHLEALEKYGITPLHRRTFAPISRLLVNH